MRFVYNEFYTDMSATSGIDFRSKIIQMNTHSINLQIWDTSVAERFQYDPTRYLQNSLGVILVYDCTDLNSFQKIPYRVENIRMHTTDSIPIVLAGNKSDLSDKVVSTEEGEALAREFGLSFFETSCIENVNVDEIFYFVAKDIEDKGLLSPWSCLLYTSDAADE